MPEDLTPVLYEPNADYFEAEHRGSYTPDPTAHKGAIVQGNVILPRETLMGHVEDYLPKSYAVQMLVGPYWQDVQSVVPSVTINGFHSSNPDQDDFMSWQVLSLSWDTVGQQGPHDELRIRLKFRLIIYGVHAQIHRLGYYLMASGRRLGEGGLSKPGPVKPQGG